MQIDFFEEFPTKENLEKLKLIDWKCTVYLASPSLKKFREIEKEVKKLNKKVSCGYWPVLRKSEGYWLSYYSKRKALLRIIKELNRNKKRLVLLWDFEKPLFAPYLFITELINKEKNKKLISNFFKKARKHNIMIHLCEPSLRLKVSCDKRIVMAYSSLSLFPSFSLRKKIQQIKKLKNSSIALGCIAKGILRVEPRIKPAKLKQDLSIVSKAGIKNAVIYRLGGLNKSYLTVIKKFL